MTRVLWRYLLTRDFWRNQNWPGLTRLAWDWGEPWWRAPFVGLVWALGWHEYGRDAP